MYTQPPEFDTHLRHRKFAKYLSDKGDIVTIITGSCLSRQDKDLLDKHHKYGIFDYNGEKYIHIKTIYSKGNGLKRMFSIFQFSCRLFIYRNKFKKPDVIIHNLHAPFDALVYFVTRKFNAKYITEVWDLWPESFVAFGLLSKKNPLLKLGYIVEKYLYTKADKIIFTMEGAKDYLHEKKWDKESGGSIDMLKYIYINNGIDIKEFDYNKEHFKIDDEILLSNDIFKVVYLGSISLANDLKKLVDAAKELKEYKKIKFLIYGDGDDRNFLEKYCLENNISNVIFKDKWIKINYVPFVVSSSSLNILNYKKNEIVKYGGSQGKLFQYLASGKPICSNLIMGYNPIEKYQAGITKEFNTPLEYAETIKQFYLMDVNEYKGFCSRAREASLEFDFNKHSEKMFNVIKSL